MICNMRHAILEISGPNDDEPAALAAALAGKTVTILGGAGCLSELAADDAVFTVDVGTPSIWATRYLKMNGKRSLLGS